MRKPSDEELFRNIPGQGAPADASEYTFADMYDGILDTARKTIGSGGVHYCYHEGSDEGESAVDALERKLDRGMHDMFEDIIGKIRKAVTQDPYCIGAFPKSERDMGNYFFTDEPEYGSVPAKFSFFQYRIERKDEERLFPELTQLQEARDKLHQSFSGAIIFFAIWMLVYVVVLATVNQWRTADGVPTLFAGWLTSRGWSQTDLENGFAYAMLLFGAVMPAVFFRGLRQKAGLKAVLVRVVVLSVLLLVLLTQLDDLEADKMLLGFSARIVLTWVFEGYFGLLLIRYGIVWGGLVWESLSYKLHRKQTIQDFLNAMDDQGRQVYRLVRLLTLWHAYETGSAEIPDVIADIAEDLDTLYQEAALYEAQASDAERT